MAARQLVDGHVQAFSRDATLEVDRKESIVATRDHVDRNVGPPFEAAPIAEREVGLRALARLALFDDLGWNVVQEVCGEVEGRTVAPACCSRLPRGDRPG